VAQAQVEAALWGKDLTAVLAQAVEIGRRLEVEVRLKLVKITRPQTMEVMVEVVQIG
jgi:hypothetical protein